MNLCIDVGGTNIKYGLIENNKIIFEDKIDTNHKKILDDILKLVSKYFNKIESVGIATAGVVDNKKGTIIYAGPTIPGYTGTKIKESVEKKFKLKCFLENDVNAAAYGEYMHRKESKDIFFITIGTGVGGALIVNGNIYTGDSFKAAEIGYIPFKNGFIQDYCSTSFIVKKSKSKNGLEVFNKAKQGKKKYIKVIDELINNLVNLILIITYTLNPHKIYIGGAISKQKNYLEKRINKILKSKLIDKQFFTKIEMAKLENSAALIGMNYIIEKNK